MPSDFPAVPDSFRGVSESHPFLRKFEASWVKRFKPTKMEPLYEAVDLAHFLVALGRTADARALVGYVTPLVPFTGNYNLWSPAGSALALGWWLSREAAPLAALRSNPHYGGDVVEYANEHLTAHPGVLVAEDTQKWRCHTLARHALGLVDARALIEAGYPGTEGFATAPLETAIAETYRVLATALG